MRLLFALAAGALAPLSFSPLDWWPLALVSVALFHYLLVATTARRAAQLGWCFGFGFFGTGASWVYVSIHDYGNAPPLLAGLLTLLFVAGLALLFALQAWVYRRYGASKYPVPGFAACWVLGEWFRSWFLTGFPWLYLGYAHVTTLLAGLAPLFGVMGISFVLALSGALLAELVLCYRRSPSVGALARSHLPTALLLVWLLAFAPRYVDWVQPAGTLEVGIVQANIPQDLKFNRDALDNNLRTHAELSESLWDKDLLVWSETAIPLVYDNATPLLDSLGARANAQGTTLITGIFARSAAGTHNSVTALGNGSGLWHKQKLVPFGEYVPLRALSTGILQLFDLPMSSLVPGPSQQEPLRAGDILVAPFVCYEIVYPDFVRRHARDAGLLITVSNDTWFGTSWGPPQHLQMAAMRALENGRYVIRATNNGISALINERGEIVAQAPQFVATTLSGSVQVFTGRTPWSRWGNWPLLGLCWLLLLANFYQIRLPLPSAGKS